VIWRPPGLEAAGHERCGQAGDSKRRDSPRCLRRLHRNPRVGQFSGMAVSRAEVRDPLVIFGLRGFSRSEMTDVDVHSIPRSEPCLPHSVGDEADALLKGEGVCGREAAGYVGRPELTVRPLSWASAQATCLPTGVAGTAADAAARRV
jgi:hypothetical protein